LETLGYHVLRAARPKEALQVAALHRDPIRLLPTDVMLPREDGRSLFLRLSAERPLLKVLYISGYTEDIILRRGVLDSGGHFLRKPFNLNGLASKVREALEES
jgi:DNA-binding response OmpR family regulator